MRPKGGAEVLETRRARALALLKKGLSLHEVARRLGCAPSSVMRWRDVVRRQGKKGLKVRPTPGRPPKLAQEQRRALADVLSRSLGQPVVIENRPGAAGNIAADQVAKAVDDHTLGVVINGNLTSARLLNPKLPYDPGKDFAFVSLLATAPLVLAAQPQLPAGAGFFEAARKAGNQWSYGSVGIGSVGHLGMEYVKSRTGNFEAVHVPYNGNPAVITAIIGGQVQMALMPPGIALPQVKAGKMQAIGLTGPRSALAPDTPSLSELGVQMDLRGHFRWGHAFITQVGGEPMPAVEAADGIRPAQVSLGRIALLICPTASLPAHLL